MKRAYKYILAAVLIAFSTTAYTQSLNSGYFTEGLTNRHDLNPAFGNDKSYFSIPLLGNVNVKMMGNFGYQDIVLDNPLYPASSSKKKTTFMNPYITDGLSGFNTGINKVNGQVLMSILSMGFKGKKSYTTLELNTRVLTDAKLPYELFEFAKNTGNKSYDIGDINLRVQSFAELAFGQSRQINSQLRIGAKAKLLLGIMNGTFEFKNVKADLSGENQWTVSGDATADISMKDFKYKTETKEYNNKYTGHESYNRINDVDLGKPLGGFGLGIDLGAEYKVNKDLSVSAALLDLGFIHWSNDMQAKNNSKSFTFGGFHDTSVTSDGGNTFDDQTDSYKDQISDFINLQDQGDKGGKTTTLGATVNLGAQYTLPAYRKLSFGLLSSTRLVSNYTWTECRLSANIAPVKWFDGGISVAMNSFALSIGWIANFHPKGFNFFVGMDHLIGQLSKEYIPLTSNASVSLGMNIAW